MSPLYAAVTVTVPLVVGVTLAEHDAIAPVPVRVQVLVPGVNETVPVGVTAVPTSVSVTVAMQVVAVLTGRVDGVQDTATLTALAFTVMAWLAPVLPECTASPA